ncbi:MAG TPA: helix-turn-helix transcriptional regulator [Bacilli bacterium]
MKSLGSRLKEMREQNSFTQVEVSRMLDISNGTLSGYERNYREPDTKTLIKLARLYNVTTDYLLTGYKMLPVKDPSLSIVEDQVKGLAAEVTHYEREFLIRSLTLLREVMSKAVQEKS